MEMVHFSVIGEHGRVKYSGTSNALPPESEGVIVPERAPSDAWWNGSAFVAMGPQPSESHMWDWPTHQWVDAATLATAKAAKRTEIDRVFCQRAAALTEGYPEPERLTWPAQQTEALAIMANPAAPTPYLDGLAAARDITPEDMRARTVAAVQAFMQASQVLVGTRQRLQTQIDAAESAEAVQAVSWPG